jgi:hypothetical protein
MSTIIKSRKSISVTSDSNSVQSLEEKEPKKVSLFSSGRKEGGSQQDEEKKYRKQPTDFSKKYDGYEKNMNLKETGKEYREENQGLGQDLKEVQGEVEKQAKGGTQTIDDIDLRSEKTLDPDLVHDKIIRKNSEILMKSNSHELEKKVETSDNFELKLVEEPLMTEKPEDNLEYQLGHKNLNDLIQKQLYRYFNKEKFYLYVMKDTRRKNSQMQVGLMCTIHYQEYKDKNIKIHEKTLTSTIERLKKLYCALGAYTGFPILFAEFGDLYQKIHRIATEDQEILKVSMEGVEHLVYQIPDSLDKETLIYFEAVKHVYVADGHHRLRAYTSLIDSINDKSNKEFSLESIFVKDPNTLPVICKHHSRALIQKSMVSEENKEKVKKRKLSKDNMSLIIRENTQTEAECKVFS